MAAVTAVVIAVAGAAAATYSAVSSAQAAEDQARYNKKVAQQTGEYNARLAEETGKVRVDNINRTVERMQAEGRALTGASGVAPGEGSSLLVQMDNEREAEIARRREAYATSVEAQGIRYQGDEQSRMFALQSKIARRQAGVTLLTGAISAASQGYGAYNTATAKAPSTPGTNLNAGTPNPGYA